MIRALLAAALSLALASPSFARTKDDAVAVTADPIVYLQIDNDAHCSGFVVNATTVGTAAHCTDGKDFIVKDSVGRTYPADPVYIDHIHDVALFKLSGINKLDAKAAPVACGVPVNVGDDVTSVGYPHDQGKVTVFGKVSAMSSPDIEGTWPDVYRLQIFASPGSSGSAVFNKAGQVIAIIVGYGNTDPTGLGMIEAVPVANLCRPEVL
jgi:S1-C subfamily serine protease